MPRKVLITGPVFGKFDAFIKRLQSVQSKAGPFEAVFSVGNSIGQAAPEAIEKIISDSQELSFPVYIFDDQGFGRSEIASKIEATPACPIQPLTSHGIRTVAGLQVAYLNTSDQDEAQKLIEEVNSADGDIDLLITSDWPANVTELATAPTGMAPDGSSVVTQVAQAARPRYHISTAPEVFYQREPYMNPDRGVGSHATRFISLATVGNSAKAKWIHALALEPASTMSAVDMCAVPEQSTQSPYLARGGQKRKVRPQFVCHAWWVARKPHPCPPSGEHRLTSIGPHSRDNQPFTVVGPGVGWMCAVLSPWCKDWAAHAWNPYTAILAAAVAWARRPSTMSSQDSVQAEQSWRFQESESKAKKGRSSVEQDPAKTVRVKNVPFSASEEDVSAYFTRAGAVEIVDWPTVDRKRSSWLFVQFTETAAVAEACKLSGQLMMGREITVMPKCGDGQDVQMKLNLGQAVKDCWFCLSNDQADVQLVVDILDEAYIAMDKGPIDDTHALIVSVEHYPNTVTLQEKALKEVHALISALQKAYASKGLQLVGFERYLAFHSRGGNHCHLNFIGVSDKAAADSRRIVENAAQSNQFSFSHVAAGDPSEVRKNVKELVQSSQYFQFFLPDGSRLVHPIDRKEKHPMSFGRECLARLAGVPGRADWRQCQAASGAEEEEKTNVFRKFWQPYSPAPS